LSDAGENPSKIPLSNVVEMEDYDKRLMIFSETFRAISWISVVKSVK